MRRYLPLILLLIGIVIVVGAFLFVRNKKTQKTIEEEKETALLDVPPQERPIVSLTPSADGHYLNLNIDKITIDAASLDYELLYQTAEGVTQGVPGTVQMSGNDTFSAELLLGSESSGNFRYDEGVENGSITLRFRNKEGKLLVKFESNFHLQKGDKTLTSQDGVFRFELEEAADSYFVTMQTVGLPENPPVEVEKGPYGVFTSYEGKFEGSVDLDSLYVYFWNGDNWDKLEGGKAPNIGIFFGSSQ